MQGTTGKDRCLAWVGFSALARTLWIMHNKVLMEGSFFKHPTNLIYKIVVLLQLWRFLARP